MRADQRTPPPPRSLAYYRLVVQTASLYFLHGRRRTFGGAASGSCWRSIGGFGACSCCGSVAGPSVRSDRTLARALAGVLAPLLAGAGRTVARRRWAAYVRGSRVSVSRAEVGPRDIGGHAGLARPARRCALGSGSPGGPRGRPEGSVGSLPRPLVVAAWRSAAGSVGVARRAPGGSRPDCFSVASAGRSWAPPKPGFGSSGAARPGPREADSRRRWRWVRRGESGRLGRSISPRSAGGGGEGALVVDRTPPCGGCGGDRGGTSVVFGHNRGDLGLASTLR